MNTGAKIASYETLLFLHADTILPNHALQYIHDTLKDKVSAGAFDLSFDTQSKVLNIIAKVASLRSRLTRLPYGDQAIFIKQKVFEKVGGYEDMMLMEDVNLMQKLKKNHIKIKILPQKVITSTRKWEDSGIIYTTLRNWILIGLYFMGVDSEKLAQFYK